jgi:hypothetical protein
MDYEELTLDQLQLQNQKLTTVSGLLNNILQLEAAEVPDIFRQYAFPVADRTACLDVSVIPTLPWISFTITNDGPDPVYVYINEKRDLREKDVMNDSLRAIAPVLDAPILVGEVMPFNIKFSGIHRVYLRCNVGDSSRVRIFAAGKRSDKEIGV